MTVPRGAYVLLVLAVVGSGWATFKLTPEGEPPESCGVTKPTLAVELCTDDEVRALLDRGESGARGTLQKQTQVDFALVVSYVGLWGATGLALHPGVAALVVLAGAADVVENLAILHRLSLPSPPPPSAIPWLARAKWGLLGLAFVLLVFLFRPDRLSARPSSIVRIATGLSYGLAGAGYLGGVLLHPRLLEWAMGPTVAAVLLQLVLHVTAHGEFERARDALRPLAPRDPSARSLSLEEVLREEYESLHGPLSREQRAAGLDGLYEAIHSLAEKRSALCLSGGGIRSATFALGVLQGLAEARVLSRFHFLSTVSGGGYIGGWLTAWLHRYGNDVQAVEGTLAAVHSDRKLEPEPEPVAHLRDYSNYLAPRPGLLSADSWTLGGTILRNLILVWLVLLPLLAAALTLPRLYVALVRDAPGSLDQDLVRTALLCFGAILLAWAVAYIGASIPSSTTALRGQGRFLILCLLPFMLSVVCLTLYWAWSSANHKWTDFVLFGVIVHLIAWIGYTVWLLTPWGAAHPWKGSFARAVRDALGELLVVVVVGAAGGALAWRVATTLFSVPSGRALLYASLAPAAFLGAFLLAATLLVGLLSSWTDDDDREWWARCGAWLLIVGGGWLVMSSLVLFGPVLLSDTVTAGLLTSVGGVSGVITLLGGWSAKSVTKPDSEPPKGLIARISRLGLPLAAMVFAAVIVIVLSTLTSGVLGWLATSLYGAELKAHLPQWPSVPAGPLKHVDVLLGSPRLLVVAVAAGLVILGSVAARLVNTNKFSLHAMYRNRLIRAYLGASNPDRHGNPFTGFDKTDNIQMHELWPTSPPPPSGAGPTGRRALFHVVNMALNLVHGDRLAWQERKAHSFTVSPLHAGSLAIGDGVGAYRRTCARPSGTRAHYGGPKGISLGTAITISGAAASPNMGYHSSPLVTFLMTVFNARLGWWLGNPGPVGEDTFYLSSPRIAVRPILAEAFGLTGRTAPYVYLSDGGHFDNLGLYEMILRRCHVIVVSDASCDEKCELNDLGGAIRKIRADLDIPIEFPKPIAIYPRSADPARRASGLYWAVGRIRYSVVDPPAAPAGDARDGWLVYIKAAFYGSEPPDVYEYGMANDRFPHEPTVDQFFTESQFESYRMLGLHATRRLFRGWTDDGSLVDFVRYVDGSPQPTGAHDT